MSVRSPKADRIVIAFSVGEAYAKGAAVAIASLLNSVNQNTLIELWVLHSELSHYSDQLIEAACVGNSNVVLRRVLLQPNFLDLPIRSDYITAETFGRLYIGDILPPEIERVLYLDSDLLVRGDLSPLWTTELGGAVVGAALEASDPTLGSERGLEHFELLGLNPSAPYFNAGVLLIDLRQFRTFRVGERCVGYVRRLHPERMDQDALNAVLPDQWVQLNPIWNLSSYYFRDASSRQRYGSLLRTARIVHYVGRRKPWKGYSRWQGDLWQCHFARLDAIVRAK